MIKHSFKVVRLTLVAALASVPALSNAQEWPTKPVRFRNDVALDGDLGIAAP